MNSRGSAVVTLWAAIAAQIVASNSLSGVSIFDAPRVLGGGELLRRLNQPVQLSSGPESEICLDPAFLAVDPVRQAVPADRAEPVRQDRTPGPSPPPTA